MGRIWGEYGASFEIKIKMQVKCKSAFRKNVDVSTIFTYTEAGSSPATRTMASVLTAFERLLRTLAFFIQRVDLGRS